MVESSKVDEGVIKSVTSPTKDLLVVPKKIPVPPDWTILYHGSNLGRDEWRGDKRNVLDEDILVNQARGLGLSCITEEDRQKQARESARMGASYDTTRRFSTIPKGKKDEPLEIRIAFPAFHSRTKMLAGVRPEYEEKYGPEQTESIVSLADKVHWRTNQQHPVIPKGLRLVKLQDFVDSGGRRIVSYVPESLKDVYDTEMSEVEK